MSASQTTDAAPCERGRSLIEWSESRMPALALLKREFAERRPLDAIRIGGSLHLTPETGALARCLRAGGASLALCGSNPLSTRDEICAALSFYDSIPTFAHYGEDRESYYAHMEAVAATRPDIVLDDGADLITFIAQKPRHSLQFIGVEQTTTGVMRLRAMERDEALPCPVVALNDAPLKAGIRQPLRHRPEHHRRHSARGQHFDCRQDGGDCGLRMGRARHREPDARPRRQRDRDRGQSDARAARLL